MWTQQESDAGMKRVTIRADLNEGMEKTRSAQPLPWYGIEMGGIEIVSCNIRHDCIALTQEHRFALNLRRPGQPRR